jgi:DNA-binding NtrC family response regulator
MRLGAADYMTKPFAFDEFLFRLKQNAKSREPRTPKVGTLGQSAEMNEIEKLAHKYARTDLPILLTGETGVGKEVTARFVHSVSAAADGPFMAVNCAAIPADLLESEIFGHERGAFTGATKRHVGYAERAGKGTLFLDEIGDMPLGLQTKILRLIEEKVFYRLGGEEPVPFRARIIAATHRDLSEREREPAFREDLYFRLSVLPLHIAPLRERPGDILWLIERLVAQASERQDKPARGLSTVAEEMALAHRWPGNVRELRNRIERAIAVSAGEWLMPEDLFPDIAGQSPKQRTFPTLSEIRDAAEKRQIERALSQTSGHIQEAARLLKISRTTLWEKMTRFGISHDRGSET